MQNTTAARDKRSNRYDGSSEQITTGKKDVTAKVPLSKGHAS
jgi:hypothetical protein